MDSFICKLPHWCNNKSIDIELSNWSVRYQIRKPFHLYSNELWNAPEASNGQRGIIHERGERGKRREREVDRVRDRLGATSKSLSKWLMRLELRKSVAKGKSTKSTKLSFTSLRPNGPFAIRPVGVDHEWPRMRETRERDI